MGLHLVTGYAGKEHVTAADQGSYNAALLGDGTFVLNRGNKFAASIISNNKIRILDGDMMMQGRHIRLLENTYEELNIDNGAQGYQRNDLIAIRYTKDAITGVENTEMVVIKGTPNQPTAVDPAYVEGDIITGHELKNEVLLYRVPIDGLNVKPLVCLFTTNDTFDAHVKNKSNPHTVTKAQIGLGSADNTADINKPVSTAQQNAINTVSNALSTHINNKSNPHTVTKAQVGLGNADNTADSVKRVNYAATAGSAANDSAGWNTHNVLVNLDTANKARVTELAAVNNKINTLNSNAGVPGAALRIFGPADNNVVYGCYSMGVYFVNGTELGMPVTGYMGFLITLSYGSSIFTKILILMNGQLYTMAQNTDGSVLASWKEK